MTDDELIEFALNYVSGRVFTSFHLPPDEQEVLIPQVFLPLAFGGLDEVAPESLQDIGALWAYMKNATTIEVEGYPTFSEMHIMSSQDWLLAAKLIQKLQTDRYSDSA